MYISKETCKDLDILYGQFFNLNSLFDRAVSVMLNDWAMVQASDIIHHRLAHLFPLMADMVSEIKDNYDESSVLYDYKKENEDRKIYKYRLKMTKDGALKYISHLDFLKLMIKAIKKSMHSEQHLSLHSLKVQGTT